MAFESIRDRWANLPALGRFVIAIGGAAALAFLVVKPGYQVFRAWRLDRNLVAAEKAIGSEKMSEVRDLALTVLQGGGQRIEAFRLLEKSTASLQDPRHGEIAKALMLHPEATDEDRWNGFRGVVEVLPLGMVAQLWVALPKNCQVDSRFAAGFANRVIADNRLAEATKVLLAVPTETRSPDLIRALVRVLIRTGKREGMDEAQQRINAGFVASGRDLPEWLALLEEIPPATLEADRLTEVRRLLESPTLADEGRSQLMLARLKWARESANREQTVDDAITRWKDPEPLLLAAFLRDLGLNSRVGGAFTSEQLIADVRLTGIVLNALAQSGDWKEMQAVLDIPGQKLPKSDEFAYRSVLAANTANPTGRVQQWNDALREAKSMGSSEALLRIGRIARKMAMSEEADQALLGAVLTGRGPLPLFNDLSPLLTSLENQERESVLLEIYAIYLPFEPGNPELFSRYTYLACLNRLVDPGALVTNMELLAKSFPQEAMAQWVLATVYLCDAKPEKAAEIFDAFGVKDLDDRVPGFRISYLTTQVMNRRMKSSDPLIKDFPWTLLKTSERKRFGELIQSAPR